MSFSMSKIVQVTNARNVLVQVPAVIVAQWSLKNKDRLVVEYNGKEDCLKIRPTKQNVG